MGMLYPRKELTQAARLLATDQAKTGLTGHVGSDGSSLKQRVERYFRNKWALIGENVTYGMSDARRIVVDLLVDCGIPTRSHRHNILNSIFDHCGVAFDTHPEYGYLCIMDFAKKR
jgi:uncharacterized protein YkwD